MTFPNGTKRASRRIFTFSQLRVTPSTYRLDEIYRPAPVKIVDASALTSSATSTASGPSDDARERGLLTLPSIVAGCPSWSIRYRPGGSPYDVSSVRLRDPSVLVAPETRVVPQRPTGPHAA